MKYNSNTYWYYACKKELILFVVSCRNISINIHLPKISLSISVISASNKVHERSKSYSASYDRTSDVHIFNSCIDTVLHVPGICKIYLSTTWTNNFNDWKVNSSRMNISIVRQLTDKIYLKRYIRHFTSVPCTVINIFKEPEACPLDGHPDDASRWKSISLAL